MTALTIEPLPAEESANEPRTLKQIIAEVQATGEPMVVTMEGKPQFVALSVEAYHAMQDRLELLDNVVSFYEAERQFERGESRPAREALEELGRKHGILP